MHSAHKNTLGSYRIALAIFAVALLLGCGLAPKDPIAQSIHTSCPDNTSLQSSRVLQWLQTATSTVATFRSGNSRLLQAIARAHSTAATPTLTPSPLVWDEGDRFPSIQIQQPNGSLVRIRLDPYMRRNKLHRLSKIAISPDMRRIALAASSEESNARVLLILNHTDSTWRLFDIAAHDIIWSNNQQVLVSALLNEQPRLIYLIGPDERPTEAFSAQHPSESVLLSQSRDGELFFITRSLGESSLVQAYRSDSPLELLLSIDTGNGPGRCTSWNGDPACILFTHSPYGELVLFKNGEKHQPTVLASGTKNGWLEDLDADKNHLVLFVRQGTNTKLQVFSGSNAAVATIGPLGPVSTLKPSAKLLPNDELRITSRAFLNRTVSIPLTSILTGSSTSTTPQRTSCADCTEESLEVPSSNGVLVPISLLRPKNSSGLLVLAYGSYGVSQFAEFSELHQSLAQRGFAVAIAHVRGGNERGPSWHRQARATNKERSVDDLLAAVAFLQKHLQVSSTSTFLSGRSAGGWLVTKAAIANPSLINGLLLDAPLLNIEGAISNPASPLFDTERLEWGTQASAIHSVLPSSPLPFHILIQLPLQDKLIPPLDTARWAIAARCAQAPGYTMLIEALTKAGHAGPDSRADARKWAALQEAFLVATTDAALRASLPETTQAH